MWYVPLPPTPLSNPQSDTQVLPLKHHCSGVPARCHNIYSRCSTLFFPEVSRAKLGAYYGRSTFSSLGLQEAWLSSHHITQVINMFREHTFPTQIQQWRQVFAKMGSLLGVYCSCLRIFWAEEVPRGERGQLPRPWLCLSNEAGLAFCFELFWPLSHPLWSHPSQDDDLMAHSAFLT